MKPLDPKALDTAGALVRAQARAALGQRIMALGLVLLFLWAGYLVYLAHLLLQHPAWAAYLGTRSAPDALVVCLGKGPCREVLLSLPRVLHHPVPVWAGFVLSLVTFLAGFFTYLAARRVRPTKLPGQAKLREDLSEFYHGISYLGVKNGRLLRYPGDLRFRHTLIIGTTGAGKTSRLFRPMLAFSALEGRSAVVVDLKYPDVGLLGLLPVWESFGRDVIVLLPYDSRSPRIPLLKGAEDDRIAQKLAEVIIPYQEREDVTSYYKHIERDFLQRLIQLEARTGRGSLGNIRYICQQGPDFLRNYVQTHAPDFERFFGYFFAMSKADQAKLVGGMVGKLSVFADPLVDRFTSFGPGEVDLSVIAHKPTLVYLGIPQERLQDAGGQLLLQLFKRYLDWKLLEESSETGSLKVPVEIYLDEFTNLGFLPRMSDNLSTMRSRRVAYILALQSYAQGLERYREEELESILANCNTHIIFPTALHDLDAERVSKALGRTSAYMESEGETSPHFLDTTAWWPRYSENRRLTELPLLAPEEMRNLDPSTLIIRPSVGDPFIVQAPRFDEAVSQPGIPGELKELAEHVLRVEETYRDLVEISTQMAADYITSPYLIPLTAGESEERPEALGLASGKEQLFSWVLESIKHGARIKVHRNPNHPDRITKLSIYPPGGLPPEEARTWEKAKWVKLEQGKSVVSLTNQPLEEFLRQYRDVVEYAEFLKRLEEWVDANAPKLQGHPLYQEGTEPVGRFRPPYVVVPEDVLASMGIDRERIKRLGRPARWENRRGYVEVPLSLEYIFQPPANEAPTAPQAE